MTAGTVGLMGAGSSGADVAVTGSAAGASAAVGLFGGPANPENPPPIATLPPGGSVSADTVAITYGPAVLFRAGPTTATSNGTSGPTGSVTSSVDLGPITQTANNPCPTNSAGGICVYGGPFTADTAGSTCTIDDTGVTAFTTFTNGQLTTATDANQDPVTVVQIPDNPAPNLRIDGSLQLSSTDIEMFTYVFNEQITNPDGSITVNAGHEILHGPTAVGDMIFGTSTCGATLVATTTSTSTSTPTSSTSSTSSTVPTSTSSTSSTVPTSTSSTSSTSSTVPTSTSSTSTTRVPSSTSTTRVPSSTSTTSTTVAPTICDTPGTATDPAPKAQASPSSVQAGADTSVTGSDFTPGESLDIDLCSSPVSLGRVTADASGAVSSTVTIPSGTALGAHTIVVSNASLSRVARVSITVVAATGGGGTGGGGTGGGGGGTGTGGGGRPLARTGADVARFGWLAGLMLLLGLWLVRAARYERYAAPWNRRRP